MLENDPKLEEDARQKDHPGAGSCDENQPPLISRLTHDSVYLSGLSLTSYNLGRGPDVPVGLTLHWARPVFLPAGGNSRTAMVAALSPADINYDETLSTLRCVPEGGGPCPDPSSGGVGVGVDPSSQVRTPLWGPSTCDSLRLQVSVGDTWVCVGPVPFSPPFGVHCGAVSSPGPPWSSPGELCSNLHSAVGLGAIGGLHLAKRHGLWDSPSGCRAGTMGGSLVPSPAGGCLATYLVGRIWPLLATQHQ